MLTRQMYFEDLLNDCLAAVENANVPAPQRGDVVAALVLSDSYNGLRKALLQAETLRSPNWTQK